MTSKENNHKPKSSQDQTVQKVKEKITMFLDASFNEMVESYKRLSDKEKVMYYEKLMFYCIPKTEVALTEVKVSDKPRPPWLSTDKPSKIKIEDSKTIKKTDKLK